MGCGATRRFPSLADGLLSFQTANDDSIIVPHGHELPSMPSQLGDQFHRVLEVPTQLNRLSCKNRRWQAQEVTNALIVNPKLILFLGLDEHGILPPVQPPVPGPKLMGDDGRHHNSQD